MTKAPPPIHPSFNPSVNAFFNALLRETGPYPWHSATGCFAITHPDSGETLWLPCRHRSSSGRHILGTPLVLTGGGQRRGLDFPSAVHWCLDLPEIRQHATESSLALFRERVLNSDRTLTETIHLLEARLDRCFYGPAGFIESEQALLNGHSIHPCPKDRGNMSTSQALSYAPEFCGHFPLAWYSVDRRYLVSHQGGRQSVDCMTASLLEGSSEKTLAAMPAGHALIPCHPFQHRQWQAIPALRRLQEDGRLRFLGMGTPQWQATSSLRAIWSTKHDWMLKFSLSVRITNSIRHLQPEEALRGPGLTRLFEREPLRQWLRQQASFHIMREPVALALCDDDDVPLPETTIVFRENPFTADQGANCELLATLLQDDPRTGLSRIANRLTAANLNAHGARQWFRRYLDVVVAPLLEAQSEFGLLFGAHQQNLVLELDDRLMPSAVWFRDCQGTGFTSLARKRFGKCVNTLIQNSGNQPPDELGIRLFCYYVFVNSTFNLITSLAAGGLASEQSLLALLRQWLTGQRQTARDTQALDYLLESPVLYAKNNLLCCLKSLNENTLEDIASIYHPMPNPLCMGHETLRETHGLREGTSQ